MVLMRIYFYFFPWPFCAMHQQQYTSSRRMRACEMHKGAIRRAQRKGLSKNKHQFVHQPADKSHLWLVINTQRSTISSTAACARRGESIYLMQLSRYMYSTQRERTIIRASSTESHGPLWLGCCDAWVLLSYNIIQRELKHCSRIHI